MTQHIGIVGCSVEGASLCYRTICAEGAKLLGPHAHPEVSMHTPSLADYVACLERGDLIIASICRLHLASSPTFGYSSNPEQYISYPDRRIQ